jgi:uncharacterized membrane protein
MITRFILYALGIYIIYKVVFNFIIPVFTTTRKIRRQFNDMQQRMQEQMNAQQGNPNQPQRPQQEATPKKARADDYIDFEEVKS